MRAARTATSAAPTTSATTMKIDGAKVDRLAKKIQNKHFAGQWNYEVMCVCCLLLADEIRRAEVPDRGKLLDDLVGQIKKYIAAETSNSGSTTFCG